MRWAIEERDYSQRRACSLVGLAPKVYRHRSRRADDGVLRTRLKELAAVRRRFGYRRLHLLLRREGFAVNHKKLYRIYREERLVVRKRGGRKRALGIRAPIALPGGRNGDGRSTSCPMLSPMGGASASWRSSTTSRASAWRWWRIPRCQAPGSPVSWMR